MVEKQVTDDGARLNRAAEVLQATPTIAMMCRHIYIQASARILRRRRLKTDITYWSSF